MAKDIIWINEPDSWFAYYTMSGIGFSLIQR